MLKKLGDRTLLKICFYTLSLWFATNKALVAQVTSDNTVGTQVNTNGNVAEITGGETRGGNLFHSFQDFSVPTNNEAFFNNSNDIGNIFSRITGGNVSNIDGLIRANGSASLFLINPAGIIFGENASLNIGGSFYGSTADSILFEDGEFGTNLDNPPILTVNAPIGFNFRDEPADITANDSGTIELNIADTIRIDGFGLSTSPNGEKREFPSSLSSNVVDSGNGGNMDIDTQNLSLSRNGQISSVVINNGNAGNININAELITIGERGNANLLPSKISAIAGSASNDGSEIANGGNITINTDWLRISDGGDIDAGISGLGSGGNIVINASNEISVRGSGIFIDGESEEIEASSSISSDILKNGRGKAGDIDLNAASLSIDRGYISADVLGEGNGGEIRISATDSIAISDRGYISADVLKGAIGNGGNLNIETGRLTLNNGSQISAVTFGNGDAGNILIRASESINLNGVSELSRGGGIFANALIGTGKGGNIDLISDRLTISDGAIITASNFPSLGEENVVTAPGTGEPGNITIQAESLNLLNEGRIEAGTQAETGSGANISLEIADSISIEGSSFISAEARKNASGGNINIDTDFIIAFPNGNNDIIASADRGRGGNIDITAESLLGIEQRPLSLFTNDINASSEFGLDGNIFIRSPDINPFQGDIELPDRIVETEATVAQVCDTDRSEAKSGLTVGGKGGISPAPDLPMEATNIAIADDTEPTSTLPQPVTTNIGKIQPARGIRVTETGEVILTAYDTDKSDRLPATNNCGT